METKPEEQKKTTTKIPLGAGGQLTPSVFCARRYGRPTDMCLLKPFSMLNLYSII